MSAISFFVFHAPWSPLQSFRDALLSSPHLTSPPGCCWAGIPCGRTPRRGFLQVLEQLTVVGPVPEAVFRRRCEEARAKANQFIVVVEIDGVRAVPTSFPSIPTHTSAPWWLPGLGVSLYESWSGDRPPFWLLKAMLGSVVSRYPSFGITVSILWVWRGGASYSGA